MPSFPPTAEQRKIVTLFAEMLDAGPVNGQGRELVVYARAGAGKTSTLVLLGDVARREGAEGQFLAFNRAIVEEARGKFRGLPVACRTLHSVAFRGFGAPMTHRMPDSKSGKPAPRNLSLAEQARVLGITDSLWITLPATDQRPAQQRELSPRFLATQVSRAIRKFCQSGDAAPTRRHVPAVQNVDVEDDYSNNGRIAAAVEPYLAKAWADLTDPAGVLPYFQGVYLKAWELAGAHIAGVQFYLIDEAQDLSPVMLSAAAKARARGVHIVYVGDSEQAIYGFTGAQDALAKAEANGAAVAHLTMSFRFGAGIAEAANFILQERLDAAPPIVGNPARPTTHLGPMGSPDAILCRTNATAVWQVIRNLELGRKVYLVGDKAREEIVSFAKAARDLQEGRRTMHPQFAGFETWDEVLAWIDEDPAAEDFDRMVKMLEHYSADEIITALSACARRSEDADVTIGTAHKVKGLEWDSVALATDFRAPKGRVRNVEEWRLLYVAVTRARFALDASSAGIFDDEDTAV